MSIGLGAAQLKNVPPFLLTGGTPPGGTYSGNGVSGGIFDPAIAGIGTSVINYSFTDGNGCTNSAQSNLDVDDCAGLKDLLINGISVFPNPATDEINILSNNEQIEFVLVFDGAGRLVEVLLIDDYNVKIDVTGYAVGLYNLEISIENNIYRVRLMRQ